MAWRVRGDVAAKFSMPKIGRGAVSISGKISCESPIHDSPRHSAGVVVGYKIGSTHIRMHPYPKAGGHAST
jgi:hypothetical protein